MRAGVAAGHPATAAAGAEILADGGSAADAVVAMALASCVAETVMSGLLAGCHAIAFDGSRVMNLDGFAAVPSGDGRPHGLSRSRSETSPSSTRSVPHRARFRDFPAALGELWERLGRLPWARLCEPALELARTGVPLPEMHARTLEMLVALYALERGAELFTTRRAPARRRATSSTSPGWCRRSKRSPTRAPRACTAARSQRRSFMSTESCSPRTISRATARCWRDPTLVAYAGRRIVTRAGLSGVPELLPRLPRLGELTETERVLALVAAFEPQPVGGEHTTNMVAVDGHGRACVLTHSLGVGAGVWLPGFDVQLNNLLGESDIVHGEPQPGDHLESRMAPTLVFDGDGLELADRLGGRNAAPHGAGHRPRRDPRRGPRRRDGGRAPARPPHPRPRRCRARRRRGGARHRSRSAAAPCGAGIGSTTTSAASAASGGQARRAIRVAAARPTTL